MIKKKVKKFIVEPTTKIVMNRVLYLQWGTYRIDESGSDVWFHNFKNIQEAHKDFGKYYMDVPHDRIKLYL
jgi:hypothetical protein